MRVLVTEVHTVLTMSLCRAFQELGVEVLLMGPGFEEADGGMPRVDRGLFRSPAGILDAWGVRNTTIAGPEILDEEIDLLLVTGHYVQRQMLRSVWPRLARNPRARLGFFCGNQMPHYRYDLAQNVLCSDAFTEAALASRIPNFRTYYPWIFYDRFFDGGPSDEPVLGTYIHQFQRRYRRDFDLTRAIIDSVPGLRLDVVENQDSGQVAARMRASMATMHIKPEEGYGYSVIESLASGRPIVLPRKYVRDRTMARWLEEGRSALLFDSAGEAQAKLVRLLADAGQRHALQQASARLIRQRIDNAEQSRILQSFLEDLRPQPRPNLWNLCLDLRHNHRPDRMPRR